MVKTYNLELDADEIAALIYQLTEAGYTGGNQELTLTLKNIYDKVVALSAKVQNEKRVGADHN